MMARELNALRAYSWPSLRVWRTLSMTGSPHTPGSSMRAMDDAEFGGFFGTVLVAICENNDIEIEDLVRDPPGIDDAPHTEDRQ